MDLETLLTNGVRGSSPQHDLFRGGARLRLSCDQPQPQSPLCIALEQLHRHLILPYTKQALPPPICVSNLVDELDRLRLLLLPLHPESFEADRAAVLALRVGIGLAQIILRYPSINANLLAKERCDTRVTSFAEIAPLARQCSSAARRERRRILCGDPAAAMYATARLTSHASAANQALL